MKKLILELMRSHTKRGNKLLTSFILSFILFPCWFDTTTKMACMCVSPATVIFANTQSMHKKNSPNILTYFAMSFSPSLLFCQGSRTMCKYYSLYAIFDGWPKLCVQTYQIFHFLCRRASHTLAKCFRICGDIVCISTNSGISRQRHSNRPLSSCAISYFPQTNTHGHTRYERSSGISRYVRDIVANGMTFF